MRSGYWAEIKSCIIGGPSRVLNVRRLHPVKAQNVLIQACVHLKRMGVAFQCRIVGEGPIRQKIEALISETDLKDSVELMGARYEAEVRRISKCKHN